jgi:AcrR family transcriptional regulator
VSLREIASQCGVSHNAIYRHFSSKEAMIDQCRTYVTEELTSSLTQAVDGPDSSEDKLVRAGEAYVGFFVRHPTYFSALYRNSSYKVTVTLDEIADNYPPFEIFRRIFAQMYSQGQFTRDEAQLRLTSYWATLHGTIALTVSRNVEMPCSWKAVIKSGF